MKTRATITRFLVLVVMLASPLHVLAQPHVGVWTSVDPHDGSRGFIGVNAARQIVFYDSNATFGCRETGGGPFLGFDENYGNSVELIGHVLVGYIEGACKSGGKNQNTSFEFGMGYFYDSDTVRSRNTVWDRTTLDPEYFVYNALELKKLSASGWDFYADSTLISGSLSGSGTNPWSYLRTAADDGPFIIPGSDCDETPALDFGVDLKACNLTQAELSYNFFELYISDVTLRGADLSGGELSAFIMSSDLSGMTMLGGQLSGGLRNVDLRWADLRFSTFGEYLLKSYAMEDVDMTGANLMGITVPGALIRSEWRNINFRRAFLMGADLSGVEVINPQFINTICPDGSNSNDNGGTCDLTWSPP